MRFHHLGLEVLSIDDSLGFYCRCLQFELEQVLLLGGEKIYFLTNGGLRLELVESKEAPNMHICFEVKDLKPLASVTLRRVGSRQSFSPNKP